MRSSLTILFFLLTLCVGSFAADIQAGATMQVKANSIWFQDAGSLKHWQQLKKGGNAAALAAYEKEVLSNRDAWQFTNPLTVKILKYDSGKNQVKVEMKAPGRMLGTTWFIDADAF
jgi:hypothetical protein